MRYFYIHSYDDVAPGYFNIPEPDETRNLEEAADETALLLVPGVAFDKNRHRCGYGKGCRKSKLFNIFTIIKCCVFQRCETFRKVKSIQAFTITEASVTNDFQTLVERNRLHAAATGESTVIYAFNAARNIHGRQ